MQNNFYHSCKLYVTLIVFLLTTLSGTLKNNVVVTNTDKMLPVTLIDATIRQNDKTLQIKWMDYSAGVKEYAIEYSNDENNFTVIGTVLHINSQTNYQFDKSLLQNGNGSIRIKSTGASAAEFTYSAVKKPTDNKTKLLAHIAVFPNPAKTELFFLDYKIYKNYSIIITDSSTNTALNTNLTANSIRIKKLKTGLYNFQIFKAGEAVAKGKFVKQ